MLERRGIRNLMDFGVDKGWARPFAAHAWSTPQAGVNGYMPAPKSRTRFHAVPNSITRRGSESGASAAIKISSLDRTLAFHACVGRA
jgi:hypothetical protein